MTTDLTAAELDALEAMLAKANEKGLSAREMQDSGRAIVYALLDAAPALLRAARREQKMREAARDVVWFQFTNCNDDARRAVERLRKALKGAP